MDDRCIITLSPNATGPFIFKGEISEQNELFDYCENLRLFDVISMCSFVTTFSYEASVFILYKNQNGWFFIEGFGRDGDGVWFDDTDMKSVSLLEMRNKIHDPDFMNTYGFTDKPEEFLSVIEQLENSH